MSETFQNLGRPEFREAARHVRPADGAAETPTPPAGGPLEPLGEGESEYVRTALERGYEWRGKGMTPAQREELEEEANDYLAALDAKVRPRVKAREFRAIYQRFDVTLPNALEVAAIAANRRRARRRLHQQGKL